MEGSKLEEDKGKTLMLLILKRLDASGVLNTRDVAKSEGIDHDEVVRVVNSMVANELVTISHK
jgi:DNA-binding IscR family transcriptional regulator